LREEKEKTEKIPCKCKYAKVECSNSGVKFARVQFRLLPEGGSRGRDFVPWSFEIKQPLEAAGKMDGVA
jgi:hypothetical protein